MIVPGYGLVRQAQSAKDIDHICKGTAGIGGMKAGQILLVSIGKNQKELYNNTPWRTAHGFSSRKYNKQDRSAF